MKTVRHLHSLLLVLFLHLLFWPAASLAQSITFDDTDPQIMVLDNGSSYELAFYKLTGSIAYIKDKSAQMELVTGLTFDDFWWMDFTDGSHMRSINYYPGEPNDFQYAWDESLKTLSLIYTPDPLAEVQVHAVVTITAYDSSYFDLQIHAENEGDGIIQNITLPRTMNLFLGQGDRVYFPIVYPGIMFGSDFFESMETRKFECDFMSVQMQEGDISMYQVYYDTSLQIVETGLFGEADPETPYNYSCHIKYLTWIPEGGTWTSQPTRIRIGQTPRESIQGFRSDNGIRDYPSLQDKLGDQFDRYARSPVYGQGFQHWDPPAFYYSDIPDQYKTYPAPAIFFINTYFPARCPVCGGYNPDYYPPEPLFGTPEDFQQMIDTLQSRGFLIMMANSSAWWDDESPTVMNLPDGLTQEDISVLNSDGSIQYYSPNPEEPSFAVSPSSPFVLQRTDENYDVFFNIYGADMIYEDAIMTPGPYDFNANAKSPLSIRRKWVDYFGTKSSYAIVPEGNNIPMNEFITGNIGTSFEGFRESYLGWDYATDDGYWRPYPLLSMLLYDKTIPYPSFGRFSYDKDAITWYLLFGCPFQIDLDEMSDRPYWVIEEHGGWIPVIHDFQGRVTSRTIGKRMIDYADLDGPATLADYGDIFIIRNWDADQSYAYDQHSIVPHGIFAWSVSGDLEAGIMNRYNGADLSPGDHYLIVETFSDSIEIRHPMGDSTHIVIGKPESWTDEGEIHAYYLTKDSIKEVMPTFDTDVIRFPLKKAIADDTRILKYLILYGDTLQVTTDTSTEVAIREFEASSEFQCYPNPFTHQTCIAFHVEDPGKVILRICDLAGKIIRVLLEDQLETGEYDIIWEGRDDQGTSVTSGLYILDAIIGDQRTFKKILKLCP